MSGGCTTPGPSATAQCWHWLQLHLSVILATPRLPWEYQCSVPARQNPTVSGAWRLTGVRPERYLAQRLFGVCGGQEFRGWWKRRCCDPELRRRPDTCNGLPAPDHFRLNEKVARTEPGRPASAERPQLALRRLHLSGRQPYGRKSDQSLAEAPRTFERLAPAVRPSRSGSAVIFHFCIVRREQDELREGVRRGREIPVFPLRLGLFYCLIDIGRGCDGSPCRGNVVFPFLRGIGKYRCIFDRVGGGASEEHCGQRRQCANSDRQKIHWTISACRP